MFVAQSQINIANLAKNLPFKNNNIAFYVAFFVALLLCKYLALL